MPPNLTMLATTPSGLEGVLARELESLGAGEVVVTPHAVHFSGSLETLYRANLACRTATRVLVLLDSSRVHSPKALYKAAQRIDWSAHVDADSTISVSAILQSSKLTHSGYAAQVVKDAIADQFRAASGKRPSVDREDADLKVALRIHQNSATLSLDSSGSSLHRRGYRPLVHETPLGESLAAGIIMLSGWDMRSPFVDGMCGSGTLPLEAAMLARGIAPGLHRESFGFQRWKGYDRALYERLVSEAKAAILPAAQAKILGSDIDPGAVGLARQHAKLAGLESDVALKVSDFAKLEPPDTPGMLIMNPPYGERKEVADLAGLYRMIGDTLKARYAGWEAWLLTGSAEAAKNVGLRTSRRLRVENGPLECVLLRYELYQGSRKTKYAKEEAPPPP